MKIVISMLFAILFFLNPSVTAQQKLINGRAVSAPAQQKLVVAHTADGRWTTSAFLSARSDATSAASYNLSDCMGSPAAAGVVQPHGAALIRDVGRFICGEFRLLNAPTNLNSLTVLSFSDKSTGDKSSFAVPPLSELVPNNQYGPIGPIASDDASGTWIVIFPSAPGLIRVTYFDESGNPIPDPNSIPPIVGELIKVDRPVTHFRLQFAPRVGHAVVSVFSDIRAYGFLSTGTPDGSNMRVFPIF